MTNEQPEYTLDDYRAAIGQLQVDSPLMVRLKRLKKRYGGEIYMAGEASGLRVYGATVDGERVQIAIGDDDKAFSHTLKGGRKPLEEPIPLEAINPADWHGMAIPARRWWLKDLVPMRQVTILTGDGGVGKSLLAEQLGVAGALQCETLGMRPEPGRVLYIGAEDDADEFHRRLADIVCAHDRQLSDLDDFRLVSLADRDALLSAPEGKSGNMQPTPLWTDIVEFAADFKPSLIVLDTSADLFGGDEIKRVQVRQFVAMLRQVAIGLDCAVVLLSHPSVAGMQSGTGSSGSTAWNNSARSRLYLTKDKDDDDMRVLTNVKNNYGRTGEEIRMRWQAGAFVLDDGKPSATRGLLNTQADKTFLALLSEINRTGRRVSSSRSVTYAPTVMAEMPGANGLSKKALEEAMRRLFAAEKIRVEMEGPQSKARQRLVVVADEIAAGRMRSDGPSNGVPTPSNGGSFQPPITPVGLEHPDPVGTGRNSIPDNDNNPDARAA